MIYFLFCFLVCNWIFIFVLTFVFDFCLHFVYIFQVLLERAEKYTGQDRRVLVTHLHDLMSVQASLTQVGTPRVTKEACVRSCSELTEYQTCPCNGVQNPCRNSGCSHLCLITPIGKRYIFVYICLHLFIFLLTNWSIWVNINWTYIFV